MIVLLTETELVFNAQSHPPTSAAIGTLCSRTISSLFTFYSSEWLNGTNTKILPLVNQISKTDIFIPTCCIVYCCRRKEENIRSDTLILAPTYGAEHGSTLGKRNMSPGVSRIDAEQCFNIQPSSSTEDCYDDGGDTRPRMDQPLRTLPGYATNSAKRKHLYESPLYSHGVRGSPARRSVYYELAVNANRPKVVEWSQSYRKPT